MHAAEFLSAIFAGLDRGWIVLWRADNKQSEWLPHDRIDTCEAIVERCRGTPKADLYYGVGVQRHLLGTDRRGDESGVIAIPGVWADVDLGEASGLKKSKKKYPPREVAVEVLAGLPRQPSCVVNSGGGFHCYWLFNELLETDSADKRERAKRLVCGWQSFLAAQMAEAGGWDLDRVHDLSRVLRPVGSWNYRYGRSVELHAGGASDGWVRYWSEDFDEWSDTSAASGHEKTDRAYQCGDLLLAEAADPPAEKLAALLSNSPEFSRVWFRKKEFPSDSERDCSIARYAVMALWSDQEIANALITHCRQWNPGRLPKLVERRDYIGRVIAEVRGDANRDHAVRALNGAAEPSAPPVSPPVDTRPMPGDGKPTDRQTIMEKLSVVFGVVVEGWVQFGKERPIYTLIIGGGRQVRVGSAAAVVKGCQAFQQAIYAHTGVVMEKVSAKAWTGICAALASICEVHEAEDAETIEMVRTGIEAFLIHRDLYSASKRDVACCLDASFIDGDSVYIRVDQFRKYINFATGDRWTQGELLNAMRSLGFERKVVNYKTDEVRTTKKYWAGPRSIFTESIGLSPIEG